MSFKGRDQRRVRMRRLMSFSDVTTGPCESKEVDEFQGA